MESLVIKIYVVFMLHSITPPVNNIDWLYLQFISAHHRMNKPLSLPICLRSADSCASAPVNPLSQHSFYFDFPVSNCSVTTYSNFILKEMPSIGQNTSVIMTLPHFPIQGWSCFQDEQPGYGEPCHEKSADDSASHREREKRRMTYTVKSAWDLHVSCSGSSHFNFSLVLPILFLDMDFCGFTGKSVTVQLLCSVPAS